MIHCSIIFVVSSTHAAVVQEETTKIHLLTASKQTQHHCSVMTMISDYQKFIYFQLFKLQTFHLFLITNIFGL